MIKEKHTLTNPYNHHTLSRYIDVYEVSAIDCAATQYSGYKGTEVTLIDQTPTGYSFDHWDITGATLTGNNFILNNDVTAQGVYTLNTGLYRNSPYINVASMTTLAEKQDQQFTIPFTQTIVDSQSPKVSLITTSAFRRINQYPVQTTNCMKITTPANISGRFSAIFNVEGETRWSGPQGGILNCPFAIGLCHGDDLRDAWTNSDFLVYSSCYKNIGQAYTSFICDCTFTGNNKSGILFFGMNGVINYPRIYGGQCNFTAEVI